MIESLVAAGQPADAEDAEDAEDGADTVRRAVRPGAVDVLELTHGLAAGTDLGEQARLGVLVRREPGFGKDVDHALRTEVARAARGRVVAVARGGGTALEVTRERPAVLAGEGLADERAPGGPPGAVLDQGAPRPVVQARQPRDGDPSAAWALYDNAQRLLTFRRSRYDIAGAQRKINEAGLPAALALRLARGE